MKSRVLLLSFLLVCGCKDRPAEAPRAPGELSAEEQGRRRDALTGLATLEHGRAPFGPSWERLTASPFREVRRALALALGRAAVPAALPALGKLLADPDPEVRAAAAFGFGCYEHRLPRGGRRPLYERLAEETEGAVIAALVLAVGRVGGTLAREVLSRGFQHPLPTVREAAGLGAGRLAAQRRYQPRFLVEPILAALARETDPAARQALAFALARLGGSAPAPLTADPDPRVRYFALSAWARAGSPDWKAAIPRLADEDWRVQVAAFRALARGGPEAAEEVAKALKSAWLSFSSSPEAQKSARVQVLLAAIEALVPHLPRGRPVMEEVYSASDADRITPRPSQEIETSLDTVHCSAGRALDIIEGVPGRVLRCGGYRVFDWVHERMAAQVLAQTQATPPAKRLELLVPIIRHRDPRVRVAAAETLKPLGNAPGARALVLEGLKSRDAAVVGALAEAVAEVSGRDPELETALLAAGAYLHRGRDAESMVAMARALGVVGSPRSAPQLLKLVADPVQEVAEAARKSFVRLYPADPSPPDERARMTGVPPPVAVPGPALLATLRTTKGKIEIALLAEETPLTVGNFVALARKGFYRNQRIHRVEPAFVTQMGDPRGDGTGGPGYTLPCELTPRRYLRGSVGMALAGRDTGGSQFFVTHIETPHLDGAYPLFGTVTSGMEVVEALVEGDILLGVTITEKS
jgi:cyclophilin family peptidyl-prolyl cis-trans isomerase/HEAT repeat protein